MSKNISLWGAPVDCGSARQGCLMGPDALRTANLVTTLKQLGHTVVDQGNLKSESNKLPEHKNKKIHHLEECASWVELLAKKMLEASQTNGSIPVFMGGDHLMAAGTVSGAANYAKMVDQPLFVLWLDAHTDIHSLQSTGSGNLHGTPVAYFTGQDGFEGYFPPLQNPVLEENVCMLGIRSVDAPERARVNATAIDIYDMRRIDEDGIADPLRAFLDRVKLANGRLHVSLDVDFLEPDMAPAVGTTVPGGATFREAHLVMEMLCDSDLVTSMDIAELNPFLDERGKTTRLMVDLIASIFGRSVMDRPTTSY